VLSSQEKWTGRDMMFNYVEFANILFELFKLDKDWTKETLAWWNTYVNNNN
jgi:hypothetical protein